MKIDFKFLKYMCTNVRNNGHKYNKKQNYLCKTCRRLFNPKYVSLKY